MTAPLERRVLLRVVNVSTELRRGVSYVEGGAPPPVEQLVQIVLWADSPDCPVLADQRITIIIREPDHPLLQGLAIDQLYELRPAEPPA